MSTLVTNTITGLSTAANITIGSTPVVSASANSLTIRGEGSAQTSVQQGLAKAWVNFDGTGTIAARDSFNVSGLTDNGTGDYTISFSSSKANINYTIVSGDFFYGIGTDDGETTAKFETNRWNDSFAKVDTAHVRCLTNGDLA